MRSDKPTQSTDEFIQKHFHFIIMRKKKIHEIVVFGHFWKSHFTFREFYSNFTKYPFPFSSSLIIYVIFKANAKNITNIQILSSLNTILILSHSHSLRFRLFFLSRSRRNSFECNFFKHKVVHSRDTPCVNLKGCRLLLRISRRYERIHRHWCLLQG